MSTKPGQLHPRLEVIFADSAYQGPLQDWTADQGLRGDDLEQHGQDPPRDDRPHAQAAEPTMNGFSTHSNRSIFAEH